MATCRPNHSLRVHSTMYRVFKVLLLWLLIATVPIQGGAAVMKACCGSMRQTAETAAHGAAQIDQSAAPMHAEHHMAVHAAMNVETGGKADGVENSHHPAMKRCSICAACGPVGFAPPPAVAAASIFGSVRKTYTPSDASFTGFIPPRLKRPPKHSFS